MLPPTLTAQLHTTARLATAAIGVQRLKVDINPIVVGVGLGFKF